MELIAVIAVIGILAAAASPSVLRMMRDNRVADASQNITDVFRLARARSMGRGAAVVVRWNKNAPLPTAAAPAGQIAVREAVADGGSACNLTPEQSCLGTDGNGSSIWADDSPRSKHVRGFDTRNRKYWQADVSFFDPDNANQMYAEMCFTPRGRTFIRYAQDGAFVPLTGIPRFEVKNTQTEFVRQIILPPNGVARVVTRLN